MKTVLIGCCLALILGLPKPGFSQNYNLDLLAHLAFANERIAGVWGYVQAGREYALVAGEVNLHIVDVTQPEAPKLIVSLPTASHWGKEVRTFSHYAYLCNQNGAGLVIYDLQKLPSPVPGDYLKKEISQAGGFATYGHTLQIDTSAATLYLNDGGSQHSWIFNLAPDPFSPAFAGFYPGGVHDGFADRDTFYAAHINEGYVAVVDAHDKVHPQVLQTFETPGKFPHNTWLTKDRKHLIAADEIANGVLSVWDLHDLENVREVGRYQSSPGKGAVPHNAFVLGDYVIASWYNDGIILLDLTRPENPVEVGRFDLDELTNSAYSGSWGNYPYLPSGIVLVSDISRGLLILRPTFKRACYLEGVALDSLSRQPLVGVQVFVLNDLEPAALTAAQGEFRTGRAKPGNYTVLFVKPGYRPIQRTIALRTAEVVKLEVGLLAVDVPAKDPSLLVLAAETGRPLANLTLVLKSKYQQLTVRTDAHGWTYVPGLFADTLDVYPDFWGRLPLRQAPVMAGQPTVIRMERGYYDDFYFDHPWQSEGQAETGFWVRATRNYD
ncbi:MAG: choice-of-anchor B family protein, partial [Saprospiraceae bacterium]